MKCRILLVDDEMDIARSIKVGLERHDFSVDVFCDPERALENYSNGAYDLLLIDLRMPKMNGFDLAREIRTKDLNTPIWFMTAFEVYSEEFRKAYPDSQDSVFVRKPISLRELIDKLTGELELRTKPLIA